MLRVGQSTGIARAIPGGVSVDMSWGEPLSGRLQEEYVVAPDGTTMRVTSRIDMGGRSAAVYSTYVRAAAGVSKAELLAERRRRLGTMEQVLKQQADKYGSD